MVTLGYAPVRPSTLQHNKSCSIGLAPLRCGPPICAKSSPRQTPVTERGAALIKEMKRGFWPSRRAIGDPIKAFQREAWRQSIRLLVAPAGRCRCAAPFRGHRNRITPPPARGKQPGAVSRGETFAVQSSRFIFDARPSSEVDLRVHPSSHRFSFDALYRTQRPILRNSGPSPLTR